MSVRSKAVPTFGTNQLYTAVLRKTAAQDIVWIATLVVSNQHNQKISEKVISSNVLVIWQQIRKLGASQCINTVHEPTQNPLLMFSLHTEQISFLPKVYGIRPDGNHRSAAGCLAGSFVFFFFYFILFTGSWMLLCCQGLCWLSHFQPKWHLWLLLLCLFADENYVKIPVHVFFLNCGQKLFKGTIQIYKTDYWL